VVLVSGADITDDINQSVTDYKAGDFAKFGKDLGDISTILSDKLHCNGFVCKLVEGMLTKAEIVFTHLKMCEAALKLVDDDFTKSFTEFKSKDYENGVKDMSAGIKALSDALTSDACGLKAEFGFLNHDSDIFSLSTGVEVAVHGIEFSGEVELFVSDFEKHDYRSAGGEIKKILDLLNGWAIKNSCTNNWCYVVEGIMEAEKILEGDIKTCEADFERAWGNFTAAVEVFTSSKVEAERVMLSLGEGDEADEEEQKILGEKLSSEIKHAMEDIGWGLKDVSKGVSDCHLDELATLLEKLAVELSLPEVGFVKEVLHILVHGKEIADEIGDACVDFGEEKYVRFGFDLAKLIKTLL